MTETCPSTLWADAGGGSCTDTPRGESCWRSVGPHGECGFDAGGLPARFRKRPRAGALRSAGTLAAQRSVSARREGEASGGLPLDTTQVGTRLVPAIFTKFMTESLPLCPLLGGGAAKGGYRGPEPSRGGSGRLPWEERGGYLRTRDSGRDIPMGRERGNRGEPWNHDTPRYTLTPD